MSTQYGKATWPSVNPETLRQIKMAVEAARKKYPRSKSNLLTLKFFVEQLAHAMRCYDDDLPLSGNAIAARDIYSFAIAAACMAVRCCEEGSAEFPRYGVYHAPDGLLFDQQLDMLTDETIKG